MLGNSAQNFLANVSRMDTDNDLAGLLDFAQNKPHSPDEMLSALEHLLAEGRLRPAFILAMILANRGQQNPIIAVALCLGGMVYGKPEEEIRGLTSLRVQANTLPLSNTQQETLHSRVIVPTVAPLLESALQNAEYPRLLRLLEILQAAIPDFQSMYESKFMGTKLGGTLLHFIENRQHRYIDKWLHYLEIYERHFAQFRNKEMSLIEFGVSHGGSLQMWKYYFGSRAKIYGVDIDPRCAVVSEENITILQGNQDDRNSLRAIRNALPKFDIIIDDGGHTMTQQIFTFEEMFSHINDGGVYLAEDLHTSYMKSHGGAHRNPGTFIEYTKNLIDKLNAHHSEDPQLFVDDYTRSAFAMHYYDSVLVIEKRRMEKPGTIRRGTPSFNNFV